MTFVIVLFDDAEPSSIPIELRGYQHFHIDRDFDKIVRWLGGHSSSTQLASRFRIIFLHPSRSSDVKRSGAKLPMLSIRSHPITRLGARVSKELSRRNTLL